MGTYKKITGIYSITNILNNKKYIGYSTNIKRRWEQHRFKLNKGTHVNIHLQNSWNLHSKNVFSFSILEVLPSNLTKEEYEEIETKWILEFNSHKSDYGYNGILPGGIYLTKDDENITNKENQIVSYVCINLLTKEKITIKSREEVQKYTSISITKISDMSSYWIGKGKRKSLNNWIVIREEDYNPEFDYIGYKKIRKDKLLTPKTWKDYEHTRKPRRKNIEDIIPTEQRNLKRVPIIAVNVLTGEERYYKMIKACYNEFNPAKVNKCLNSPFGKYQHRGHYFKRAEE